MNRAAGRSTDLGSVMDFADHAFTGTVNVCVVVDDFSAVSLGLRPVEFEAMREILKNEVNLLDRDQLGAI